VRNLNAREDVHKGVHAAQHMAAPIKTCSLSSVFLVAITSKRARHSPSHNI
jgi:hypothetical protein